MAKKEKTESNIFNCRVSSKAKSKELRNRIKSLSDNSTYEEVIEDGVLYHEGKDLEGTVLKMKGRKIALREIYLTKFLSLNAEIQAHNLRLRSISSRHKNLDPTDNVLFLKICDKDENVLYEFKYDKELLDNLK